MNSNFNYTYMKNDWGLILITALLYIYYSILKRFLTWLLYTNSQIVFFYSLPETRSFVEKIDKIKEFQLQQFSLFFFWNPGHDLPLIILKPLWKRTLYLNSHKILFLLTFKNLILVFTVFFFWWNINSY